MDYYLCLSSLRLSKSKVARGEGGGTKENHNQHRRAAEFKLQERGNETTGCSLNIVFFLKILSFFLNCCCSAGVLPAWCVYIHWHRGKTEKGKSPEYFKIFQKTQYLINTLYNLLFLRIGWKIIYLFSFLNVFFSLFKLEYTYNFWRLLNKRTG